MADVVDDTLGSVEGPDATQAFLGGSAGVAPDADGRVRVVRNGAFGSVPAGELEAFLRATPGARIAAPGEVLERQAQREYGDGIGNELRAALEGAGRAATLGLSDVAISEIGGEGAREGLAQRRERNPLAAATGAAAGVAATALVGGGAGGLAKLLSATPAGLAMRAGQAVGGTLTGAGVSVATRAGAAAVSGALEGALFGAGEGVTDWALNPIAQERTAERLMASVVDRAGSGALLGGLASGAGSLAAGAVGAGSRKARELLKRLGAGKNADDAAAGLSLRSRGTSTTSATDDLTVELESGQSLGKSPFSKLAEGATARQRFSELQQQATREATRDINTVVRAADETFGRSAGVGLKPGAARKLFRDQPPADLTHTTGAVVDALSTIDDTMGALRKQVDVYEKRGLKAFDDVRQDISEIAGGIMTRNRSGTLATPEELEAAFIGMDRLKRRIGSVRKSVGYVDQGASSALNEQYEKLRLLLEDDVVWGAGAAGLQKTVNPKITAYLDYANAFDNGFALARGSQTSRSAADAFERVAEADPAKVGSALGSIGKAENAHAEDVLVTGMRRRVEMLETLSEQYQLDAAGVAKVREARKALERIEGTTKRLNELRVTGDRWDETIQQLSDVPFIGGNLAKVKVSTGRALALTQDMQAEAAATRLSAMQRIYMASEGIGQRIADATQRYARVAGTGTRRLVGALPAVSGEYTAESRRKRFDAAYASVRDFERDPQAALRRALRTQASLGTVAPVLASTYAAKATQAAAFLAEKVPRPPMRTHALARDPGDDPPRVSDTEMRDFLEYVDAIERPLGVLDQLERRKVSPRTVEAIKAVYPRLYEDIRAGVMRELESAESEPDYHDRLSLGVLFDLPTDPALEPDMLAALQESAATSGVVTPEGQQAMLAPSRRTAPELAGMHETRSQATARR